MRQCGARHTTDDNVIRSMLDNEGYIHTEYVICSGFAREQSLYESASMLHLKVYSLLFLVYRIAQEQASLCMNS